jgi:membrane protease subunit (stomatin/prohibitin family)
MFELRTANVPFWTTISKIMQNFTSEHKARIYFVRLTEFLNQKWGTKSPIKYNDPVYKFPVGMRAFGNFSFHITDPRKFFTEIASNQTVVPISSVRNVIVDRIMTPLADVFATAGFSYAEIDKNRMELSKQLSEMVAVEFEPLGFEMSDFRIENTDFDEKTQERIDKISDKMADAQAINAMGQINNQSLHAYSTLEKLNALNAAASNPNGMAGAGVGMGAGMGMGMGMNMGGMMTQGMAQQQQAPMAPPHTAAQWHVTVNGQTLGPYGEGDLANMAAKGEFTPDSLVWTAGQDGWKKAGEVQGLTKIFGQTPPPPPPPAAG